jgi:hypothetical protein
MRLHDEGRAGQDVAEATMGGETQEVRLAWPHLGSERALEETCLAGFGALKLQRHA